MKLPYRSSKKYWRLFIISLALTSVLLIPIKIIIAMHQAPQPQAFLVLGGEPKREEATAQIARWFPNLNIWLSSVPNPLETKKIFQSEGINLARLNIDQRAADTVTNFTTLVNDFQQAKIQHLYLITSDYHMLRAQAIGTFVLGSRGIVFTPVSVASNQPQESKSRIVRDILRSILWIFTGQTGASY
ncbi:hypothetical protein NIES4071_19450 [Calothrix sp. NIES-4071]|nr:hypothetical protein NIES4071_19450 [Calothrix sp. NIES-4071]BAZ56278.1 hypothetical protein NIES4105_19400 [Calothrix sp. NIES-4105]